jgi:ABC-2 type transport system permease protein
MTVTEHPPTAPAVAAPPVDRHPPSAMRAVVTIARTDFSRLARDRVALFFIVVLPVVIIVIIGTSMGSQASHTPIGVVDLDRTEASAQLVQALRDSGVVEPSLFESTKEMQQQIRTQNVVGGISIPAGYAATLDRGDVAVVTLLADQKQESTMTLSSVVGNVIDRQGQVLAAARFAAAQTNGDPQLLLERAKANQLRLQPVTVEVEMTGRESLSSTNRFAYTAPSNLVLFVFINSITGATALVESRRLGVTRRTLAAPISVGTLVLGAGCTRLLVALLQSVLILVVGSVIFGVRWGDPLAVTALVLVFAFLATGAGLLIGSLAKKPEQVPAMGIPISMGLAMLGGCMWPLEVVPPALQAAGHLTPHAWAMDAWIAVSFEGGGLSAIAVDLLVLGGAAAVLLALANWRLRRVLRA